MNENKQLDISSDNCFDSPRSESRSKKEEANDSSDEDASSVERDNINI